jgi:hypothetical protein
VNSLAVGLVALDDVVVEEVVVVVDVVVAIAVHVGLPPER